MMARGSRLALNHRWSEGVLEVWLYEVRGERVRRYLRSDSGEILAWFTDGHAAGLVLTDTSGFPYGLRTGPTVPAVPGGQRVQLNLSDADAVYLRNRLGEAGVESIDLTVAASQAKAELDSAIQAATGRPRRFWNVLAAVATVALLLVGGLILWRHDPETNRTTAGVWLACAGLVWLGAASTAWAATEGVRLQLNQGRTPRFSVGRVALAGAGIVVFPLCYQLVQYVW